MQRAHGLDALRAIAIICVIASHLGQSWERSGVIQSSSPWFRVTQSGAFGVQLFFILSGYLLSLLYGDQTFNREKFFFRRAGRILPLWFIYIGVWFAIHNVLKTSPIYESPITWLLLLLLLTSLTPQASNSFLQGNSSISSEWIFYLFFPLLRKLSSRQLIYLCVAFYIFGFILRIHYKFHTSPRNAPNFTFLEWIGLFGFWNAAPFFIAGILLQRYTKKISNKTQIQKISTLLSIPLLIIVFFFNMEVYIEIWLFIWLVFFTAFYSRTKIPLFLQWIGQRSYGLFFSHFLFIGLFERVSIFHVESSNTMSAIAEIAFVGTGSFIMSSLTWRLIENPIISWTHRQGRETKSS